MTSDVEVVRSCFKAFEDKDRNSIENIIADEFRFISPLDNAIDRKTYFERCWPISASVEKFNLRNLIGTAGQVFVTYESVLKNGKSFRNTEIFEVTDGKVVSIEVYFGWNLPHPAIPGNFVDEETEPTAVRDKREPDPAYGDGTEA
jgi:hypothetical protein